MNQLTAHAAALASAIRSLIEAVDLYRTTQLADDQPRTLAAGERVDQALTRARQHLDARTCQQIVAAVTPRKNVEISL